jgi:ferredoxin-NADP reductase
VPEPLPRASAEPAFPITLMTAKNGYFCHSQHRGVPALRKRSPVPRIDIPAGLAAQREIAEGDRVEIRTPQGRVTMTARIDPALTDGVAVAEYGWWQACPDLGLAGFDLLGPDDANYNSLTSDAVRDPISGAPGYRSLPCHVARIDCGVRPWRDFRPLVLSSATRETSDVVCLEFSRPDGGPMPRFAAGQFLTLALDGTDGETQLVRSYSLCGPVEDSPRRYRVAVKILEQGAVSPLLAAAEPGRVMLAQAPAGRFLLPLENEFPIVALAGGIGITPFIGFLETLERQSRRPEIHLYYVVPSGSRHPFAARIRQLVQTMPELKVVTLYSRPGPADRPGVDYDRAGRLTFDVIDPNLIRRRARFYMCGPDGMMRALSASLHRAGVPKFEIFQERFVSPAPPRQDGTASSHAVIFRRSNLKVQWTPQAGSLLDLAERNGIKVPTGCRVGQCESCAVTLLEGLVVHDLPPEDLDENACLACRAVPASDIVVDA